MITTYREAVKTYSEQHCDKKSLCTTAVDTPLTADLTC